MTSVSPVTLGMSVTVEWCRIQLIEVRFKLLKKSLRSAQEYLAIVTENLLKEVSLRERCTFKTR